MRPRPKVAAAGVGGAASILVVWVLGVVGLDVPPEVAGAIATVLSFASGYFKSE